MFLVSSFIVREVILTEHARLKHSKATSFLWFSSSKLAATAIPMSVAVFVAASRAVDNWHHPSDIVAGTLLGLYCGHVGWYMFNPSLEAEVGEIQSARGGGGMRKGPFTELTPLL